MIARIAGTLVLPDEVHTATIGAQVCTQLTLIDVCLENENSKHPAISFCL